MKRGVLCVITDTVLQDRYSHAGLARQAAWGGADLVQLRHKAPATTAALMEAAADAQVAMLGTACGLVVNDRADVALAVGARGVHLGRHDLPVDVARRILGQRAWIGGTANSLAEAVEVARTPVDYLGVGPVFGTRTKASPAPALGLEGLWAIVQAVDKPVMAIGNIDVDTVEDVLATGAWGIAVVAAVVLADSPQQATAALRARMDAWLAAHPTSTREARRGAGRITPG